MESNRLFNGHAWFIVWLASFLSGNNANQKTFTVFHQLRSALLHCCYDVVIIVVVMMVSFLLFLEYKSKSNVHASFRIFIISEEITMLIVAGW